MADTPIIIMRAEAKAKGLTRYFTGNVCKNGHTAELVVANGGCILCLKDAERRHRDSNREKFRKKWRDYEKNASPERREQHRKADKAWRDANPEKNRERIDAWEAANPERKLEHGRAWRLRNLETKQEQVRIWRDENRDSPEYKAKAVKRMTDWAKANPEGVRKLSNARRARKAAAEGSHTKEELLAILERQDWKCADPRCGASLREKRTMDHIIALSKGGSNYASNIQFLCKPCNSRKHNKDHEVWALECVGG